MIANLFKIIILFIGVYYVVKFVRFFILLLRTATTNLNAESRQDKTINEKKNKKSDIIELNKDQYKVD